MKPGNRERVAARATRNIDAVAAFAAKAIQGDRSVGVNYLAPRPEAKRYAMTNVSGTT